MRQAEWNLLWGRSFHRAKCSSPSPGGASDAASSREDARRHFAAGVSRGAEVWASSLQPDWIKIKKNEPRDVRSGREAEKCHDAWSAARDVNYSAEASGPCLITHGRQSTWRATGQPADCRKTSWAVTRRSAAPDRNVLFWSYNIENS